MFVGTHPTKLSIDAEEAPTPTAMTDPACVGTADSAQGILFRGVRVAIAAVWNLIPATPMTFG
ncbi:hypothetical protein IU470_14620 [Nocardia abscessus]|uniref:Uncharacterized protein n=1 Tax=Nocardia abscessus TaxID=120957 RepID=A0ABS0C954_9NOCA|nr:hypothetical protein [Nocardia abscessus]MBF6226331.1 hypothetical protein [Nocardia abscessus]